MALNKFQAKVPEIKFHQMCAFVLHISIYVTSFTSSHRLMSLLELLPCTAKMADHKSDKLVLLQQNLCDSC